MFTLRALGHVDLRDAQGYAVRSVLAQPKRFALLAYLGCAHPRGFHRRDTLTAVFWPELDQEHARAALRKSVYVLRRSLHEEVIVNCGDEDLAISDTLQCDATQFEERLRTGDLGEAVELYQGDLLPSLFVKGAPEFERWLEERRGYLRRRAYEAALELTTRADADGDSAQALRWARRAVTLADADERAIRLLLEFLDRTGCAATAICEYEAFAARLRNGYDLSPAVATEAVIEEIRTRNRNCTAGPTLLEAHPPAALVTELDSAAVRSPADQKSRPARHQAVVGGTLVAILGLAVLGLTKAYESRQASLAAAPAERSAKRLAVLTFENLSASPEETDFFVNGVRAEIHGQMSTLPGLQVISLASSQQHGATREPLRAIGRKLGVPVVLEASVRLIDDRVRVVAQLTDTRTSVVQWTQTYDRDITGILDVQSQIALDIAGALQAELSPRDVQRIRRKPTHDLAAYNLYLRGRHLWSQTTAETLKRSIDYLKQAVAIDSNFALAYVALAEAESILGEGQTLPAEYWPQVRNAAEKALAIDSTIGDAHAVLADRLMRWEFDWRGAEHGFRRALELNPNSGSSYLWYSQFLGTMRRHGEAIAMAERALQLDPLSPFVSLSLAGQYTIAGQYERAHRQLLEALELAPGHWAIRLGLGLNHYAQRQFTSAIKELEKAVELSGGTFAQSSLAMAYARGGRVGEARALLRIMHERLATKYVPATHFAGVHAALNEPEQALAWLRKGYHERAFAMPEMMTVWPMLGDVRGHPGFRAIARAMRLEE